MPEQGFVQVFAPRVGVITTINVEEGSEVEQGAPLLTLSTEVQSTKLGDTQAEVMRQLFARRESLVLERRQMPTERRIAT